VPPGVDVGSVQLVACLQEHPSGGDSRNGTFERGQHAVDLTAEPQDAERRLGGPVLRGEGVSGIAALVLPVGGVRQGPFAQQPRQVCPAREPAAGDARGLDHLVQRGVLNFRNR